jgi:gluconate 2-dehydrogenase gamma chain
MKQDRRRFLTGLGVLSAASRMPPLLASAEALADSMPGVSPAAPAAPFRYFTAPEAEFVEAALARLIPKDELGPGAKEAGVAEFIDRQLAGPFGRMERCYRLGPWLEGTPQQGYQSPLTPAEAYRFAIAEVEGICQDRHGQRFAELPSAVQDEVLRGLDEGTLPLASVKSSLFFGLLWQNAQEGFFSDPIYGGNRDRVGWKLVGFPGVAAVYTGLIEKHGVPYRVEPVSIADLQRKSVRVDEHGHPVHTPRGDGDGG